MTRIIQTNAFAHCFSVFELHLSGLGHPAAAHDGCAHVERCSHACASIERRAQRCHPALASAATSAGRRARACGQRLCRGPRDCEHTYICPQECKLCSSSQSGPRAATNGAHTQRPLSSAARNPPSRLCHTSRPHRRGLKSVNQGKVLTKPTVWSGTMVQSSRHEMTRPAAVWS